MKKFILLAILTLSLIGILFFSFLPEAKDSKKPNNPKILDPYSMQIQLNQFNKLV